MRTGLERSVGGVVLAGGGGRRFGGPKATAVLAGTTLVERAVAILGSRCAEIVVVSRPGVRLPVLAASVVLDRPGPDAPLVAVATGLAALGTDDCLVLACDLPLAGPVIDQLLSASDGAAVAVDDTRRPQPLCARYPRAATLAECDRLLGRGAAAMGDLLEALSPAWVTAGDEALLNVNTPADLARAEALLGSRRVRERWRRSGE